jgi:hypothetical protein
VSLRSKKEILDQAANTEGASNEAILMAALNESQEEYKRLSGQILLELDAVKSSVRASNEKKVIDIQEVLQNATETILEDMRGKISTYLVEVETATIKLQELKKEKVKDDRWDNIKWGIMFFGMLVVSFAVGGYIANVAWGHWYDVPQKLDALNNGIYQLLLQR